MSIQVSAAERKSANVLAEPVAKSVNVQVLAEAIHVDFIQYVVGAITDHDRGIDRIEYQLHEDEHFFLGYRGLTIRLVVSVIIHDAMKTAEVTLRATKGDRDALDDTDWGDQGANVGNSVLVARAFHVGLVALRRGGIQTLINHPYDSRVRARYTSMGFVGGECLDLVSAGSLTRAFDFVAQIYAHHGLDLDDPPP